MKSLKLSRPKLIGLILFAIVMAVVFRLYMLGGIDEMFYGRIQSGMPIGSVIRNAVSDILASWELYVVTVLVIALGWLFLTKKAIPEFIYKYRYLIALGVFAVCVLFGLSGSSVGMWCNLLGAEDKGLILGTSRLIRSDEWAVGTPTILAQAYNGGDSFSYFSETMRGSLTDYYLGFRQPVYDIAMIFKPFLIGYLFLPVANGLSFFWFGRLIALVLVSFEFGMFLTKGRKGLSAVFMMLVTFAPAVQWWYSSAMADLLIYSMLAVVLFDKYAKEKSWVRRIPYTAGILACAGCFIMVLYPSWQVPFAYVLLGLILYVILENRKNFRFGIKDAAVIVVGCAAVGAVLLYIFNKSSEAFKAISGTVYPGERFETGGGFLGGMTEYFNNIWMPFTDFVPGPLANQCENAQFIDLFPICYVPAFVVLIRDKIKDRFLIIMMVVTAFLGLWCSVGFPGFLARITFMYNSQACRAVLIFELCNIMLLVRGISLMTKSLGRGVCAGLAGAGALVCALINYIPNREFYAGYTMAKLALFAVSVIVFAAVFYLTPRCSAKSSHSVWVALLILIMFMSGAAVNPLRKDVDALDNIEWIQEIKEVGEKNSGDDSYESRLWLVDNERLPFNNLPLLAGRTTFNVTAVYPDLDKMKILDPTGKYNDVYNRYSHITTVIVDEGEPYFELAGAEDAIIVYMTLEDAQKLGVSYITSRRDLSDFDTGQTKLVQINDSNSYYIYQIQ